MCHHLASSALQELLLWARCQAEEAKQAATILTAARLQTSARPQTTALAVGVAAGVPGQTTGAGLQGQRRLAQSSGRGLSVAQLQGQTVRAPATMQESEGG